MQGKAKKPSAIVRSCIVILLLSTMVSQTLAKAPEKIKRKTGVHGVLESSVGWGLLRSANSKRPYDRRTSIYLLGDVILSDQQQTKLVENCKLAQEWQDRLLCGYTLFSQTQDSKYQAWFINAYPRSKDQSEFWAFYSDGMALRWPAAILALLADMAAKDDKALNILVALTHSADGVYRGMLAEKLANLYSADPSRILEHIETTSDSQELLEELKYITSPQRKK
jgi:hypothetical protein